MKNIRPVLMALLLLAQGCGSKVAEGTFLLEGTVGNADSCTALYLVSPDSGIDTISVANGNFSFRDSLNAPVDERVLTDRYPMGRGDRNMVKLYFEEGRLAITIPDADSLSNAKMTGSVTQAEIDEINAAVKPYYEPLTKLSDEFYKVRSAGDKERLSQIEKEMDELRKSYLEVEGKWISEHPLSYYAFQSRSQELSRMSFEEVDSLYNAFPEKLKGTMVYRRVEKELGNLRKCAPGAVAPDFSDKDINGVEFSLSSLKGHYVILDFWASWCGPCRASMPHVLALYEKYKGKGLEVVCVADDDHSLDKWKDAVEKDGTQAFHHVLRGLKRTADGGYDTSEDKSSDYAVHFLPTKYLIGPDFTVIGKVDDKQLDAELQKAFGF